MGIHSTDNHIACAWCMRFSVSSFQHLKSTPIHNFFLKNMILCTLSVNLGDMREKWRETKRERVLQLGAALEDKENEEEPKKRNNFSVSSDPFIGSDTARSRVTLLMRSQV